MAPPVGYVAYIDEAGDDGVKRVRPLDPVGGTEWFTIGAFVVEAQVNSQPREWLSRILTDMRAKQRKDLHFAELSPERRQAVSDFMSGLPARYFVGISHKPSLRGYRNERAERIAKQNWFYNWMARLLLEQVTKYCRGHAMRKYGEPRTVRVEFSTRGGHRYSRTLDYLARIQLQSANNRLHLKAGDLAWDMVDLSQIVSFPHANRPGLQLADVVASAFYQALPETPIIGQQVRVGRPSYAQVLKPRIAEGPNGKHFGRGVFLWPVDGLHRISDEQRSIFEFYGAQRPRKAAGIPAP
nr:DUF3800 domain-containing protein [Roseicella sp. DB1501]